MKKPSRRLLINTFLVGAFGFTNHSNAAQKPKMIIKTLIDTLGAINKPVCDQAASKLLSLNVNQSSYDLHLRHADLNLNEIKLIAAAIKTVDANQGPALKSFSMSYHPNLEDEGVFVLVNTLPATVTELGLVNCGLGDPSAAALMIWAAKASNLHWLCVEENAFSDKVKDRLKQLGEQTKGLLVVT